MSRQKIAALRYRLRVRIYDSKLIYGDVCLCCETVVYLDAYLPDRVNAVFSHEVVCAVDASGGGIMYRQNSVIELAGLDCREDVLEAAVEFELLIAENKACGGLRVGSGGALTAYACGA